MLEKRCPKEIVLTDGKEITLRPVTANDARALNNFYKAFPSSDRWFLKEDPCDVAVIKKWINNHQQGKALDVLAWYDGSIVAHAGLLQRPYGGRKHIGRLRIIVAPEFRGKQLGTWMVFDLIRRAMDLGLEVIRADFVIGVEDAAIEAAQKLDFIKEARLQNYVQDENGNSHDYQIMIKHLHRGWSDF